MFRLVFGLILTAQSVSAQGMHEFRGDLIHPELCYFTAAEEAKKLPKGEAINQRLAAQSADAPTDIADDFAAVEAATRDRHEAQKRLVNALLAICEKLPVPSD